MSLNDLGPADYQLYLLRSMDPPPDLLSRALEAVGASSQDMQRQADRISEISRPGVGMAAKLRDVLGGASAGEGRYRFPLWPEFEFEMEFEAEGRFLQRAEFVRASGGEEPGRPPAVWHSLKKESLDRYEDVSEIDLWGHFESYSALNASEGRRYFLRFGWGLLQEITPM